MSLLRSLLFIPGNKANMLEKALGVRPDAFVPDMEDSVPNAEKAAARDTIRKHLPALAAAGPLVIPRVNALDTGLTEDDLAAVVGPHIAGVCIGKIRRTEDLDAVSALLERLEQRAGLEAGQVKLIPWLESAEAIVNAPALCRAARLLGVAFGAEDYTQDMGIERLDDEAQLAYPRAAVCIAARAARIAAFDTPYFQYKNDEGLRANALAAKRMGFKGKFAIHPAQIQALNETFAPSPAEIEHARRVVEAFEAAERQGRGSTSLDGKVIDVPVVKRARDVLALATQLGVQP